MKKVYTDEQIVDFLREAVRSEQTTKDFCRATGLNETTFYKWKRRFGTMEVEEVKDFKQLPQENARLKRLLAERDLEVDVLKEVIAKKVVTVAQKKAVVKFVCQRNFSERRACRLVGIERKTVRYRRRRTANGALEAEITSLAFRYMRFGYRRIWACLRRDGQLINRKRVWRIWQKLGLGLKRRTSRKKRLGHNFELLPKAAETNQVWTYDFVFDRSASGARLKMLTLCDEFTRECLAVEVGRSLTGANVKQVLERVFKERGALPDFIRSDNGSEFVAAPVKEWLGENQVKTIYIEPGRPWQNGKCES